MGFIKPIIGNIKEHERQMKAISKLMAVTPKEPKHKVAITERQMEMIYALSVWGIPDIKALEEVTGLKLPRMEQREA